MFNSKTSFVKRFEHDIFLSYAHVDNEKVFGKEGWVSTLVTNLCLLVNRKLRRKDSVSIWWDKTNLHGNDEITPEIHEKVQNSATILLVMSPGYLGSQWCIQELELFFEKLPDGSGKRIFVVDLQPPDKDQETTEELADILGYRFWYFDKDNNRVRALEIDAPEPHKTNYIRRVEDLASDISHRLKTMAKETPSASEEPKATVYLAEVTDDLDLRRDQVRRYMEDDQIRALPTRRYLEGQTFHKALVEDLKQCTLFVQLLGEFPGKTPPEILQGYTRLQLKEAKALNLPILQWRDPTLVVEEVASKDQRELLESETVYAESLESFKQRVVQTTSRPTPPTSSPSVQSAPFVFINAEGCDRNLAEDIRDQVDDRLTKFLPNSEGKAAEIRRDLEDKLRECDALIVVYGEAPLTWVDKQLLYYRRIIPERNRKLRILGICDGPPEVKQEVSTRMPGLEILPFRMGLDKQRLNSFLTPLLEERKER